MNSLRLGELRKLQESGVIAGDYTVLLNGASRLIRFHPEWPWCQNELTSARETFENWRRLAQVIAA